MRRSRRTRPSVTVQVFTLALALFGLALPVFAQSQDDAASTREAREAARADALRRARVWLEPAVPIEQVRFDVNPSDPQRPALPDDVTCRFDPETASGTSPKFRCVAADGEQLRIKYGAENPEVFAEVAATRLLSALGFPTDQLHTVRGVRCFGCPPDPFRALQSCWRDRTIDDKCLAANVRSTYVDFTPAVIERRLDAPEITARKVEGWGWKELQTIDAAAGGASRAEIDALRLMAVFLSHWDNKPENQRLVCLDTGAREDSTTPCARPLAMVQDLGGTFGPFKADLHGWASAPVWADPSSCRISMRTLPYGGSSFNDVVISEAGRAFLAERLARLSPQQIRALFEGARFGAAPHAAADTKQTIDGWVEAFDAKRRAIMQQRCPRDAAPPA